MAVAATLLFCIDAAVLSLHHRMADKQTVHGEESLNPRVNVNGLFVCLFACSWHIIVCLCVCLPVKGVNTRTIHLHNDDDDDDDVVVTQTQGIFCTHDI